MERIIKGVIWVFCVEKGEEDGTIKVVSWAFFEIIGRIKNFDDVFEIFLKYIFFFICVYFQICNMFKLRN